MKKEPLLAGRPLRWTPNRKLEALRLVRDGQIGRHLALKLWQVSEDEWQSWERRYRSGGRDGLRVTRRE